MNDESFDLLEVFKRDRKGKCKVCGRKLSPPTIKETATLIKVETKHYCKTFNGNAVVTVTYKKIKDLKKADNF